MPKLGLGLSLPVMSRSASGPSYDPDALTYINAVQAADGQALEAGVKTAINTFVVGCKTDSIWSAIKASCILAGARTLSGALVPLAGDAPSNIGFNSGDYSRTLGLKGDGTTKYLNSNRNNNVDPQNSKHISVYCTSSSTRDASRVLLGTTGSAGGTALSTNGSAIAFRVNSAITPASIATGSVPIVGLVAVNRASSIDFNYRFSLGSSVVANVSTTPRSENFNVFSNPALTSLSDARISFYSIGESINLSTLSSRVTSLMGDILSALS